MAYGLRFTTGTGPIEPIDGIEFSAFPWPRGYPLVDPWRYRVGDTEPDLHVVVSSRAGPINPDPISAAILVLDRYEVPNHQIALYLAIEAEMFSRQLRDFDLDEPGTYRGVVRLVMLSGRVLTVPVDDRITFKIAARHTETEP